MNETKPRWTYLTLAVRGDGITGDTFDDLLSEPTDDRVEEALSSNHTIGLFNGVSVSRLTSVDSHAHKLKLAFQAATEPDSWRVIKDNEITLDTSLSLIAMESVQSLANCPPKLSFEFVESILLGQRSDELMFAALAGITQSPWTTDWVDLLVTFSKQAEIDEVSKKWLRKALAETTDLAG